MPDLVLSVSREEGVLTAHVHNDDSYGRMRAMLPTRRPRERPKVAEAPLASFPKFRKLVSARSV